MCIDNEFMDYHRAVLQQDIAEYVEDKRSHDYSFGVLYDAAPGMEPALCMGTPTPDTWIDLHDAQCSPSTSYRVFHWADKDL